MNLPALYNWQGTLREMLQDLSYWQSLTLAMYSLRMVLARQSAPSKVAEKLGGRCMDLMESIGESWARSAEASRRREAAMGRDLII